MAFGEPSSRQPSSTQCGQSIRGPPALAGSGSGSGSHAGARSGSGAGSRSGSGSGAGTGASVGEACRRRTWSVQTCAKLVAVGAAVGRASVSQLMV